LSLTRLKNIVGSFIFVVWIASKHQRKQFVMYTLNVPHKSEYPALLSVWESSVIATHHFVPKEDIEFFKNLIQEKEVFDHLALTVARDSNDRIIGIMGVTGDDLSMLFVAANFIGKGVGKLLISYAIDQLRVKKVDVNEQNELAIKFYESFGFKTVARSELDDNGKPYPLLHMKLM
jgi:putative acetyltransferase